VLWPAKPVLPVLTGERIDNEKTAATGSSPILCSRAEKNEKQSIASAAWANRSASRAAQNFYDRTSEPRRFGFGILSVRATPRDFSRRASWRELFGSALAFFKGQPTNLHERHVA
jgi:hypothetical protein